MLMRMFAIARCAATPSTCESANAVDGIDERRACRGERQRRQEVGTPSADDVVDEDFGGCRKDEPSQPVYEHQAQPEREAAAMSPNEFPGLGPGVRDVRLALFGLRHRSSLDARCELPGSSRQLPVFDAVRLVRRGAQAPVPVGFVILVVALEPHHLAFPFEGQHVRRDAIEEPPIVADDDDAPGELQERLLERAQRIDVEVVSGLVEQQHVAAVP